MSRQTEKETEKGGLPLPDENRTQHRPATEDEGNASDASSAINVVDWDGHDDPLNPLNWTQQRKNALVIFVSMFSLYGNLASTMFAPASSQLASEFVITNSVVEAMTVSIYVLGFALGPIVLAPLSEVYGRLGVYHSCSVVFFAFTLGCAFSTDTAMFMVFRFLCGCAASGPMSIGGGMVADVTPQEERGKAMGLFAIGPLLGPVIGPIIGGFVAETIGWRWTFRIILILAGIFGIASFLLMKESNSTVLLQRKTARLRRETGNEKLLPKDATEQQTPGELLLNAIVRPMKMLVFSPIVLLMSLYNGVIFGLIFLLFATFPTVFEGVYGFNAGIAGLAYIGLGLGMFFGLVLFAVMSDKLLGQKKGESVAKPEMRLILMKYVAPVTPLGCFIYGWTTYYHVHWIAPIIGTFIIGLGALFVVMPTQVYLVDAFGAKAAASALAANLVVRSPFGAFLDLAAAPLYDKLGLGWGNSVLGFICLAFTPVPWLFYHYGEHLRNRFPVKL